MTCKEEGCGFVTDSAEDEAHLPLVMKVILMRMRMMVAYNDGSSVLIILGMLPHKLAPFHDDTDL